MALEPKEKNIDKKDEMQKERRSFLKKAAYSAPALVVMGQLVKPTQSRAWGEQTPSDPVVVG